MPVGERRRKLSFFLMVSCYSRLLYVEFTLSQSMEQFLACHQHAFEFFGNRLPKAIMVDNLKSAVLRRLTGEPPVLNARYRDFSEHYNFSIRPCAVGKGNEKGRVENGVGYVKKNLLNGLEVGDFSALNPAARVWMDTIANVRTHGETHQRPVDLFAQEKPTLSPAPVQPYDIGTMHTVRASSRFRVTWETNRYSVPAEYASTMLTLKVYPERLCLYHQDKLIARHARCYDRHRDFEDPDHPKALLAQRRNARAQKLLGRFLSLSPRAEAYYRAKTLEQFQWSWPKKINRTQVQNLFRLQFIEHKGNVIFLGGVGLGKTHLATALGYAACLGGHSVRFASAVDAINTLVAAQNAGRLKQALAPYLKPSVLVLDELGYLPIDKTGADLLFQIISQRYERGSLIITSNRVFQKWPEIFNNDATLTSALLDRLLHHAETILIQGNSYRMKDQIET